MRKARQLLPEGLAEMPPGPGLAGVLATIDLACLSGADCVEVLRARHRQAAHDQAGLMAAMVEVALCDIGPDDELPRMDAPDEFSADEIRGALSWTRSAADSQLSLAWDVIHRLPRVFAALDAGTIDAPKARVFSEWTDGLTDEQASQICDRLLDEAPTLTTGQLADRIKKLAIAIDPSWARRRYEAAVRTRRVVGYRNEDGSANVSGLNLPADRAAAACAHIDMLAKKVKRAGDRRPIDLIRADLYIGMLDGSFTGWSERDIITHLLAAGEADAVARRFRRADPGGPARTGGQGPDRTSRSDEADSCSGGGSPNSKQRGDRPRGRPDERRFAVPGKPDAGGPPVARRQVIDGPWPPHPGQPGPDRTPFPSLQREGVEIRAEVTTMLGLDDHPGEIAGWGPVHADLARRLVHDQTAAEWRYAITDDDGRLLFEGITRRRPSGYPSRAESPTRGGIVELQVPLSTLRRLATRSARPGGWAKVVADLARHADQQTDQRVCPYEPAAATDTNGTDTTGAPPGDDQGPRSPERSLRRRTQIRDRTCIHPGCRAPAAGTDGDHTRDWARGGATIEGNIGSLCRHDHRLRHEGGWQVTQPTPGHFTLTSRLGRGYHVHPPLIIQPLPDPIPRNLSATAHLADHDEGEGFAPIWSVPAAPDPKPARPPPDPHEPIPF